MASRQIKRYSRNASGPGRVESWLGYGLAAVAAGLALVLRLAVAPWLGEYETWATFDLAVILVAWRVGWRPAIVTAGLGLVTGIWLVLPPQGAFQVHGSIQWIQVLIYCGVSSAFILVIRSARREKAFSEAVINALPGLFYMIDEQEYLRRWNENFERVTGYSGGEIGRMRAEEFIAPQERDLVRERIREVFREGASQVEARFQRKDGSQTPYLCTGCCFELGPGRWLVGMAIDLSERKRAEERLHESEERFRLLVEGVREYAIYGLDREGRVTTWNSGAKQLKGYQEQEIIGEHFSRFFTPEDVAQGKPARELTVAAKEGLFSEEGWRVRKDGSRFWAGVTLSALRGPGGELRGFTKVTQDLSERKQVEEALRRQERLLRVVLGLLPVGVWIFDAQGRMVQNNPAASLIWGGVRHQAGEAFGEYRGRLAGSGRQLEAADWAVSRALGRGELSLHEEIEIEGVEAKSKTILVSALPIRDREGAISGAVMVNEEITQRKEAERVLREHAASLEKTVDERTAKLRELVAELEHMSYSIIHDMRAPLRAIAGYASVLRETEGERLSAESGQYLTQMRKAVGLMDSLITDALNYNKAVREELPLEAVDVAGLLESMVRSYPEFQGPKADICLMGSFPRVLANPSGLMQCFSQLLSNAVKFVNPGQTPKIRIRAELVANSELTPGNPPPSIGYPRPTINPQMVRIWIEDNGVGIPKGREQRIFEMFQRMHGADYPGTGIGLALVRKVMERMGGRVGVESEEGRGSRFWVELAVAVAVAERTVP